MRYFGIAATFLLFTGAVLAADKDAGKPSQLTSKEVADGWIMLFDGETTFGWKVEGPGQVDDGVLVLGGNKAVEAWLTTGLTEDLEWHFECRTQATATALPQVSRGLRVLPA